MTSLKHNNDSSSQTIKVNFARKWQKSYLLMAICLFTLTWGTSTTAFGQTTDLKGTWVLDSISETRILSSGAEEKRNLTEVPEELMNSCPKKIEIKSDENVIVYLHNTHFNTISFKASGSTLTISLFPGHKAEYKFEQKDNSLFLYSDFETTDIDSKSIKYQNVYKYKLSNK